MLASWNGNEDAAVFDIDAERYGILTVDFITPVVDDPYTWGQVAAANALSDVFAIGGRPIVVLNTVCFPTKYRALDVLRKILEGGFERVRAAGTFLAGGYSVQDDEPKYGLVVYGEVEKSKLWRTTGAMAGDKLILTKPLGTGIAVTAIKADMIDMPRELHSAEVHAATDVTGLGLTGLVCDMLGENLDCCINLCDVPSVTRVKKFADMCLIPE